MNRQNERVIKSIDRAMNCIDGIFYDMNVRFNCLISINQRKEQYYMATYQFLKTLIRDIFNDCIINIVQFEFNSGLGKLSNIYLRGVMDNKFNEKFKMDIKKTFYEEE